MDIDFIEIGTSNFDTLLQKSTEGQTGFSVEPLKYYLNKLPNKSGIAKVNAAITSNRTSNLVKMFYIPEEIIDKYRLPDWFKGCNTINTFHPLHIKHGVQQFVQIETAPLINIDEFLIHFNIRGIKYLKIDTEGHDIVILKGLFTYLSEKSKEYYPKEILFESNDLTSRDDLKSVINTASELGYAMISSDHDTLLRLL